MKLKLLASKIRSHAPSVKRHHEEKGKFVILLLLIGLFFFSVSVVLYIFRGLLPHFNFPNEELITPRSVANSDINFKKYFQKEGIVYESISYATESPTLIVKLPDSAYVYFNSTEDPTSAIKILKNILSRVAIENKNKKIKYIDLRFEKAVVRF